MLGKVVNALVLKSHTVKHALCRFHHSRVVVALSRIKRCTFYYYATYAFKRHEVSKLNTISESARCCHHRVF